MPLAQTRAGPNSYEKLGDGQPVVLPRAADPQGFPDTVGPFVEITLARQGRPAWVMMAYWAKGFVCPEALMRPRWSIRRC